MKKFLVCVILVFVILTTMCYRNDKIPADDEVSSVISVINQKSLSEYDSSVRYFYSQLSQDEQTIYATLVDGIASMQSEIELPFPISADTYRKIYTLIYRQEPQFFYLSPEYNIADIMNTAKISYRLSPEKASEINERLSAIAEQVKTQLNGANAYQSFVAIHDYIISSCDYTTDTENSDNIYGSLIEKRAGCEGYSKAILYLSRKLGLNAMMVTGHTDDGTNHAWNIVEIDNNFYQLDATWDDPISETPEIPDVTYHFYCLTQDSGFIGVTHFPDDNYFEIPKCNSLGGTYYIQQGLFAKNYDEVKNIISQEITKATAQQKRFIELRVSDSELLEYTKSMLFDNQEIFEILRNTDTGNLLNTSRYYKQCSESMNTILIGLEYI